MYFLSFSVVNDDTNTKRSILHLRIYQSNCKICYNYKFESGYFKIIMGKIRLLNLY